MSDRRPARGPGGASSGAARPRDGVDHARDRLDDLADALRDRLLAEAGDASGDGALSLTERIAALVDREAGLLDARSRAELATRIARRSFGLGPLEPLLADPSVD